MGIKEGGHIYFDDPTWRSWSVARINVQMPGSGVCVFGQKSVPIILNLWICCWGNVLL